MPTQEIAFNLDISAQELQRYYLGSANVVNVIADDGRRIQFPVSALRPYVLHDGVKGHFVMRVDDCNKLIDICQNPK
ncbi:MAG: DUF2835 domain-containing protein [Gammaproteobacteria bacterium]